MTMRIAVGLRVSLLLLIGGMMASVAMAKKPIKPPDDGP